jgi:isoquinoline 1-oxidoreductase alpha subunit
LLWVLRDTLGLTGTKFGCGAGICGACSVQIDGQVMRSCIMPLSGVGKGKVTTVESLSPDRTHRLQQAWIAEQVPQCGYCQSGMLMAADALLKATPRPTDAQIETAMTNLCRCGTYSRVRRAIKRAAGMSLEDE